MNASSALCLAGGTGVLLCSMVLSAEPTPIASLAIAIQMAESLAFRALCSRSCSIQLLYSYANASNVKPMPNSSASLFFGGKSDSTDPASWFFRLSAEVSQ